MRFSSGWQLKTALAFLLYRAVNTWYKVFEVSWPNGCCTMNSGLSGLGSSPSQSRRSVVLSKTLKMPQNSNISVRSLPL